MANPVQPPLQDPGSTSPLDLPEMQKLLTKVENKDDQALNLSKSLSGALDLEQNGHSLPFKVISEGHRQSSLSGSPSRASSRRASSIITTSYAQDQEAPKDYLVLAIASCFCPVWPLNLIPLIFSIMVSTMLCSGKRFGHLRAAGMSSGNELKVPRSIGCWNLGRNPFSSLHFPSRGGLRLSSVCSSFMSASGYHRLTSCCPCWQKDSGVHLE